jgi:hypothetical protein
MKNMKLFKIIMNCVIATLLIMSVTINIFVLAGFRVVNTDTYTPNTNVSQNENMDEQDEFKKPDKKHNKKDNNCFENTSTEDTEEFEGIVVYEDDNIIVTYFGIKENTDELTYLFEIENLSNKTINVTFDEIYIDGQRVYNSGLTCEKLLPETSQTEDFVIKEFEGEQDSDSYEEFTFNIKLMNAKSYLDLYETEQVKVEV